MRPQSPDDREVQIIAAQSLAQALQHRLNSGQLKYEDLAAHAMGDAGTVCGTPTCQVSYTLLQAAVPQTHCVVFMLVIRHAQPTLTAHIISSMCGPMPDDHQIPEIRQTLIAGFESQRPAMTETADSISRRRAAATTGSRELALN